MIRLGFVGVGWIGRNRMEAMLACPYTEAIAICEPNPEMAQEAGKLAPDAQLVGSLDEMLALKPDGVVIATPSAMHADQCIRALEAGAAVFCQKPLGRNEAESAALIDAYLERANTLARLTAPDH
jgi:predicted dehydrogenase